MTLLLFVLWVAGGQFHLWWFLIAFVIDVLWFILKVNFFLVLLRRSIEDTVASMIAALTPPEDSPPPPSA